MSSSSSLNHEEIELTELLEEEKNETSKKETNNTGTSYLLRVANTLCVSALRFQSASQDYVKQKSHKEVGYSSLDTVVDVEPNHNVLETDDQILTTLNNLTVKEDRQAHLERIGGVEAIAKHLKSDLVNGIDEETVAHRRIVFGANIPENPLSRTFVFFFWRALLQVKILVLIICGAVSLGLGIKVDGPKEGLKDGVSIIVGVFMAIIFVATSDYWHAKVFQKLLDDSYKINIEVVRGGIRQKVTIVDIVVGDVVCLNYGDKVPANGLLIMSHSLKLERNNKGSCSEEQDEHVELDSVNDDIFFFSGTKVVDGFALMLVTSVGMNARREQNVNIIHESMQPTPLETRLEKMNSATDWIGYASILGVLIFTIFGGLSFTTTDDDGNKKPAKGLAKVNIIVSMIVTLITSVVNIADPLRLTLTLTRAYAMKKLKEQNAMVRKLSSIENMSFVDTICINKTGTLTMNQMKVSEFWLDNNCVAKEKYSSISPKIIRLLQEGIALNTLSISPTEAAIKTWALQDLKIDIDNIKTNIDILHIGAFTPEKKQSWILAQKKVDKTIQVHLKGAAQLILEVCSRYYDAFGIVKGLDHDQKKELDQIIQEMATRKLRCIALAHKVETKEVQDDDNKEKLLEDNMILLGIVGIEDPCRPKMKEVVKDLHNAGVKLKMITGDNIFIAKAIAEECGILEQHGGEIVEAAKFRRCNAKQRRKMANEICVMANSSPEDKRLIVECLRDDGNVVGVVVHGTSNSSAMKEAIVGIYMGKEGTEIIEEHSDIVISEGNFCSITKIFKWGRCVYSNTQKFIQFQLTASSVPLLSNIAGVFVAESFPLSTIQLLWVSLITDTLACLAFANERPTKELMKKPPVRNTDPLITNIMFRNVLPQALFETALILLITNEFIYPIDVDKVRDTFVFNAYVFCQVFNQINSRKLDTKNVFEKIHANKLFWVTAGFIILLQTLLVEILKLIADTVKLTWLHWGLCIGISSLTLPIGFIMRFVPVPRKQVMDYCIVVRTIVWCILKKVVSIVTLAYEALPSICRTQNSTTEGHVE
ncbi:hypothetical protein CsatB_026226 [Cannabis sativa]